VAAGAKEAVAHVRAGSGPAFLQTNLERWPGSHQTKPEFPTGVTDLSLAWEEDRIEGQHADWVRDHDGLRAYTKTLVDDGSLTRERVLEMDREVLDLLAKAREFAEASPYPDPDSLMNNVFA
jgi:TPP-dependent pyruvate/acetoin dehydrogenase alpha subunit